MKQKHFLLIISTLLLTHCGDPAKDHNADKSETKDSCCIKNSESKNTETEIRSEITCPECGFKKMEIMPTDVCLIKYTCERCTTEMTPFENDCCVFCSHGTHKCPSMQ